MKPVVQFGLPTYGHIAPAAHLSAISLVSYSVANGHAAGYLSSELALVDVARNNIVKCAMMDSSHPTHIMWLDADMIVPKTALRDLLSHDKPVVGGLYFKRTPPYDPAAYSSLRPFTAVDVGGKPQGLFQVAGIGLGCTLVAIEVYEKMAAHFEDETWHALSSEKGSEGPIYVGEDIWFARRCAEIGVEMWLDASIDCGHVTDCVVAKGRLELKSQE